MSARVIQIHIAPKGGLPKRPVSRGVVTPFGLEGDAQAHPQIHGGPRQALLLISKEVIDELIAHGYPLFHGALGENFTVEGLDRRTLRAGQRYRIGSDVIIELTKPRGPCKALDVYGADLRPKIHDQLVKAGDPTSPHWGMSGFYASVVEGGEVFPGAPIIFLDQAV